MPPHGVYEEDEEVVTRRRNLDDNVTTRLDNNALSTPRNVKPLDRNKSRRVHIATSEEISCPPTAWPTIAVFLGSLCLFIAPILLTWKKPSYWTIPISIIANYILFTPLHDAVHRSVSIEHRWLNELVGYTCAFVFLSPFKAFRYIHLEHHKHTNDPEKDPDHWSAGTGPWWIQPLFWGTQNIVYYYKYLDAIMSRPALEALEVAGSFMCIVVILVYAFCQGWGSRLAHFVFIPHFIAVTFLAYSFDYAPHRPHDVTRAQDIYGCTSMIGGVFDPQEETDLTWPLLYQNYHNIHHLYPMIPFYKYAAVWTNHRQELRELGTPITNWVGSLRVK